MRLRTTAPPNARPALMPKRLSSRPLAAKNTVNRRLDRLRPLRYTASNWARWVSRPRRRAVADGPGGGPLDAREFVAPLPAARRKDPPPAFGFHACAEAVGLVAAAHLGLKRTLGQSSFSSKGIGAAALRAAPLDVNETISVNGAFGAVKL
jgi:hypothetical protein